MQRAGLVYRLRGVFPGLEAAPNDGLVFLDGEEAIAITTMGNRTHLATLDGARLFVSSCDGQLVSVLHIGDEPTSDRAPVVLCRVARTGETVGLAGGEVVTAGLFEITEEGAAHQGGRVPRASVAKLYERTMAALWARRAMSGRVEEEPRETT